MEPAAQVPLCLQPVADQDKPVFNSTPLRKLEFDHFNNDGETKPANCKGELSDIEMDLWPKVLMTIKHNHNRFPWQTWTCIYKGCFDLLDDELKQGTDAEVKAKFQKMVIMLRQQGFLTLRTNPAPGSTYLQGDHYQFFINGTHPDAPVDKIDRTIMTNAWSVQSLLTFAANEKTGGKPGFDQEISLLRAIQYFPNRKVVPQNVGNVANELAQFEAHFVLSPKGPYNPTSDSDVNVRIRETPEIVELLKQLRLCIVQKPVASWGPKPDAAVPYASGAASQSAVPLPAADPAPAAGGDAVMTQAETASGGDVGMTDAGASVANNAKGKGKTRSDAAPAAPGSWTATSSSGTYASQWGHGTAGEWQVWSGPTQPATTQWTGEQQASGNWRQQQYSGYKPGKSGK